MVDFAPHPLVAAEPGGVCWKRSDRRRPGRGPEAHRELVVLLGLSGQARYLMDGAVHALERGSLLWAFSGQAHVLLSDEPAFDMWVFLISERVLPPGESAAMPPVARPDTGGVAPRRLAEPALLELDANAALLRSETCPVAQRTGLRWWLYRAWAHWQAAAEDKTRRVHPAVERAARVLRARPEMSLSVLAREAGLSQTRLARVFKAETGLSLGEFRTDQKLERVDSLMRTTRTTLTIAALDAGFGSYSQFFRVFRERRKVSPREFYTGKRKGA